MNSNVLFLTQPVDYVHIINEESPLYELSQDVLSSGEPLELIVIMAGKIFFYFCIIEIINEDTIIHS